MKIDPHCQRQKCRPVTLVSGDIRFMRIFVEVPWGGGATNDNRAVDNGNFQRLPFARAISSETLEIRPALLHSDTQSVVGFSVITKCMTLKFERP